jgi:hypothetical protein
MLYNAFLDEHIVLKDSSKVAVKLPDKSSEAG